MDELSWIIFDDDPNELIEPVNVWLNLYMAMCGLDMKTNEVLDDKLTYLGVNPDDFKKLFWSTLR